MHWYQAWRKKNLPSSPASQKSGDTWLWEAINRVATEWGPLKQDLFTSISIGWDPMLMLGGAEWAAHAGTYDDSSPLVLPQETHTTGATLATLECRRHIKTF